MYICAQFYTLSHMKKLFVLALFILSFNAFAGWQHSITHYTRADYQAASQNWKVAQSPNGWMYFANNKGLLEFDGESWNTYPFNNVKMRTLLIDPDGRIYAGGLRQFGYYAPNATGRLEFVDLSEPFDINTRGNIQNIHRLDAHRICFQADNHALYIYDTTTDKTKSIQWHDNVTSAMIDGRFYLAGLGLFTLEDDQIVEVDGTPTMRSYSNTLIGLYQYAGGLLFVLNDGRLLLYKEKTFIELSTTVRDFLQGRHANSSALDGNVLALGSLQDGVILYQIGTDQIEQISAKNGLQDQAILSVAFDQNKNIWVGLDNGIDCIHLESSIPQTCTGIGSGYSSIVYNSRLWLGTGRGLFYSDADFLSGGSGDALATEYSFGQIRSLFTYGDELFVGGSNLSAVVYGDKIVRLPRSIRGAWNFLPIDQNRILVGTYTGFYLLHKNNGVWDVLKKVKGEGVNFSAKSMLAEPTGNAIWIANKEDGLWRYSFSEDGETVYSRQNFNDDRLTTGDNVCIKLIDGNVTIASRKGLFRYDNVASRLINDTILENRLAGPGAYTFIHQDANRNVWYVKDGTLRSLRYDHQTSRYSDESQQAWLAGALVEDFEHLLFQDDHVIVATEDGFSCIRVDEKTEAPHPHVAVRSVWLLGVNDSLAYNVSFAGQRPEKLNIDHLHNSLRFSLSSNRLDYSSALLYSYKLTGATQEDWTQPSTVASKEYTALNPGDYTLHIRIWNDAKASFDETFQFSILPPWYKTWWAKIIYVLLFFAAIHYIVYRIWKSRKKLVMRKDEELHQQREQFEHTLEEQKLKSELEYKSEELIRSTLNLVRKNEMLQSIKQEVVNISHSINEDNLVQVRRRTLRLLGQIDVNLEHDEDLQAFQRNFDTVHNDFFKYLDKAFPNLSAKDKQLCAYIKMNLLSKEIAPLLNISVRGVEIGRYRLRKKLGLADGESLTAFLQSLTTNVENKH